MLKFCILGVSHPHVLTMYRQLVKFPDEAECIGFADTPSYDERTSKEKIDENLGKWANEIKHFENYKDLIKLKPNLAIICCDNADCKNIAFECMEKGIHVALEKPMTDTYKNAEAIFNAHKEYGVKLIINWPIAAFESFNKAKQLIDDGRIGKVMRVQYRSPATWGPYSYSPSGENPPIEELKKTWWYKKERGGGSVLDYACYGAALTTWFFNKKAKGVQTIKKNFCLDGIDIEDYSAMLLDFEDGVGFLEGSWSTFNPAEIPTGPVCYGTEGVIVCDRHSNLCKLYLGKSHPPIAPTEVYECAPDINKEFGRDAINHILYNKPLHPLRQPQLNLDVMYILDEGRK